MAGRRRPELGQHYLRNSVARRLVELSAVGPQDSVVEIGPGLGALTTHLAARAHDLTAIEVDGRLAERLAARFRGYPHVRIVAADIRAFGLPTTDFVVVANIPFGITAEVVRRVTEAPARDAWLIVQREAAHRYAGYPWADETLQSLLLKPSWHIELRGFPRRADFEPPPSVDAAVLHLRRRDRTLVESPAEYRRFVEQCFGRGVTITECTRRHVTRPQLQRLASNLHFSVAAPPSALTFEQWLAIYRFVSGGLL